MRSGLPQERPPAFTYTTPGLFLKGGRELRVDDLPLRQLAQKYGTPLYVYSGSTIRQRFREFDQAFARQSHTVCYSVKANSNLSILRLLASLGAGFDVVSGGELHRVLTAKKRSASRVVFSGVGKLATEIDAALKARILLFNVESASELELLAARALHLRKYANFAIRVNPDVHAETHPYISTGLHEHKFGVPLRDAAALYRSRAASSSLRAAGVSVHIGSQITEVSPFGETMQRVAALVENLRADRHDIRYIDAGGGLGISYDSVPSLNFAKQAKNYASALLGPLKNLGVHLLLEPGRSIVGPAGVLLTRVLYRKQNNGKRFIVVDAAMNDFMRPALYGAHHEIVPLVLGNELTHNARTRPLARVATSKVDIVGPVCESGDFFARDRELPEVNEGDLLAILDAGAYGMSLASNYNTRPRPAEVLVEGKRSRLIRGRESYSDLLARELL